MCMERESERQRETMYIRIYYCIIYICIHTHTHIYICIWYTGFNTLAYAHTHTGRSLPQRPGAGEMLSTARKKIIGAARCGSISTISRSRPCTDTHTLTHTPPAPQPIHTTLCAPISSTPLLHRMRRRASCLSNMTTRRGRAWSTSRLLAGLRSCSSLWPRPTSSRRDLTRSCVRHDSSMGATWLIGECDMTHWWVRHDSVDACQGEGVREALFIQHSRW